MLKPTCMALALSIALIGAAHSLQQAQSTTEKSQPGNPNARKAAAPVSDQRGTERQPLVVKALEAEKTTERLQQEEAENKQKTERETNLVFWTLMLTAATVALALIAAGQLVMFLRQLKLMRAGFDNAADATRVAQAEFASTHRPKLIVRRIYLRPNDQIAYEVANVGATGAEVLDAKMTVCFDKLPPGRPDYGDDDHVRSDYIHAGTYFEFVYIITNKEVIEEINFRKGFPGTRKQGDGIFLVGYVTYKDRLSGVGRRTAFCRVYDFGAERFMPLPAPDPDYEHVD